MDNQQETINAIALTRLNYFSLAGMLELYRELGSATAVIDHRADIRDVLPDASPRLIEALKDIDDALRVAESELRFDEAHSISVLTMNDSRYPARLRECADAPLVLFYKGTADLNRRRVVSIVGTRRCTAYGQDLIARFCDDLRTISPDALIVSGLAYGVDVCAHRNALRTGFDTAAVLAHGLDYIYPSAHRDTAVQMIAHGGLLTEFLTGTNADKMNFVRRNRIVAGIADATIVVESATHGGSLITASIAQAYNRDVFAFPGTVDMKYSQGCNNLIRDNAASLINNAADFTAAMGWDSDTELREARRQGIERQLFPELSDDEQTIVDALTKNNDLQTSVLSVQTGVPIQRVQALIFTLEMKGVVKMYAGSTCHLMK